MKRVLEPGDELISAEWLRKYATAINGRPVTTNESIVLETAVFEVEADEDGYTHLLVDMWEEKSQSVAFEIENGWICDGEMKTSRVGIGLYRKLDDLKALLEVLSRGLV